MKLISAKIHGILDYVTVLFLVASPSLFAMSDTARYFTYTLSAVHLVLTFLTNFDMGLIKLVPLKLHGMIELLVSFVLAGISFYFRSEGDAIAFYFYLVFAIVLFIVWILSDYSGKAGKMLQ